MKIQLPDKFDLNHPERYFLIIEVHPIQFCFLLYDPQDDFSFFYRIPENEQPNAFARFQNVFFDNEFFTLPFKKVYIINYTPIFTYVPTPLFEEKDKKEYMKFHFIGQPGKILCQNLQKPPVSILHGMPEEIYDFFHRSFEHIHIVHHTAPLIRYFRNKIQLENWNRMIVNKQGKYLDILCFSHADFLLGNHFICLQPADALCYTLFVWRQMQFNQLKDFIYVMGDKTDLIRQLQIYIQNIIPVDLTPDIPFEMTALTLCE
ncbi:MAG: DUF3822 family protein [Candidatus Azobacteroides sp.]|nr:DUF3822 family protein [Candidatus Azobacteroides sp.]